MLAAIFGLSGAFIFGAADFLGGLASKRISPVLATAVAAVTGLVALLVALPFVGGEWSPAAILWGGLSGVCGAIAISLLYACLAIGPMSILSPLTAVVSAIVPMTIGLVSGDRLAPIGYWGLGLALVAVVLVGFVPEKGAVRPSLPGMLMAIGSGIAIGAFLVLIDLTPDESGLVPLVMNRAVSGTIMFSAIGILTLLAMRKRRSLVLAGPAAPDGPFDKSTAKVTDVASADQASGRTALRTGIRIAIICGVVDSFANYLLLLGIRVGDLSVMSVLTAMYPAGTILLAAVVLKERIAPVQWAGLALALTAAGMLAIA